MTTAVSVSSVAIVGPIGAHREHRHRPPAFHLASLSLSRQAMGIEFARRLPGRANMNLSTTQRPMHFDDRELVEAQDPVE